VATITDYRVHGHGVGSTQIGLICMLMFRD